MAKKVTNIRQFKSMKEIGVITADPPKPHAVKRLPPGVDTYAGAKAWLDNQIEKSKDGIFTVEQTLTAPLARLLLDMNLDNRRASKWTVKNYARQMRDGNFEVNGQAIIISVCGNLNDGQHRLLSALEADVELSMLFTFGVKRDTRKTLDQGRRRTAADFLTMDGEEATIAAAGVAHLLWQWRTLGEIKRQPETRPAASEIAKYAEANIDQIRNSLRVTPRKGSTIVGGFPVLPFCHAIFGEIDMEQATDFITRLVNGHNIKENSGLMSVRRSFMRRERLTKAERVELIVRAWNADREDREITGSLPIHRKTVLPV
jgi:hypothetical protein